eukprot:4501063-Amphidinium_carterae.1
MIKSFESLLGGKILQDASTVAARHVLELNYYLFFPCALGFGCFRSVRWCETCDMSTRLEKSSDRS